MQQNRCADILIIGGQQGLGKALKKLLATPETWVRVVSDFKVGASTPEPPGLILVSFQLEENNTIAIIKAIKAEPAFENVPVLCFGEAVDTATRLAVLRLGVRDILVDMSPAEMLIRIHMHMDAASKRQALLDEMESKCQLIQMTAHDLKNPIAKITLAGHILLESKAIKQSAQLTPVINQILKSSDTMDRLVKSLLCYAEVEAGIGLDFASMDMNAFMTDLIDNFRLLARINGIQLTYYPPENAIEFEFDPLRLNQALSNLLSNAIKFTPRAGRIDVALLNRHHAAMIVIADNGIGIAEKDLPHIFDKFYRVHTPQSDRTEGTGLGLAIAKTIIEQHHGVIAVYSEQGKGTTFQILLPDPAALDFAQLTSDEVHALMDAW